MAKVKVKAVKKKKAPVKPKLDSGYDGLLTKKIIATVKKRKK